MSWHSVIFDLDGTLLDTLDDLADSGNGALRALGCPPHPAVAYRMFVGDGVRQLARRILPEALRDQATIERCAELIAQEYRGRWAARTRPYDGIPELLREAGARGVRMAVLSNKPDEFTRLCVEKMLPDAPFAAVLGARPDVPHKPDPTGALLLAERLGVAPPEVLYVGDTNTDMRTAVAAGMHALGVLWGFRGAEELRASGARLLAAHPRDILRLLGSGERAP